MGGTQGGVTAFRVGWPLYEGVMLCPYLMSVLLLLLFKPQQRAWSCHKPSAALPVMGAWAAWPHMAPPGVGVDG